MKISKKDVQDISGLTNIQEGILFNYLSPNNGQQHFEQTVLSTDLEIDFNIFSECWNYIAKQNEMLRVVYRWEKLKKPLQLILKEPNFNIDYIDISDALDSENEVSNILQEDLKHKFDLEQTPFRIKLLKLKDKSFLIVISSCSIIYDGWSFKILLNEFIESYKLLLEGKTLQDKNKLAYKEFIKNINEVNVKGEENYWKEYFNEFVNESNSYLKEKRLDGINKLDKFVLNIGEDLSNIIDKTIQSSNISASTYFYLVWGILLQKLNNSNEGVFGTVYSGRSSLKNNFEDVVGLFINTLPVRVKNSGSNTILELLKKVNDDIINHASYEHTSLKKIEEYTNITKLNEIFNTIFITEAFQIGDNSLSNTSNSKLEIQSFDHASSYDITLFLINTQKGYEIHFCYFINRITENKIRNIAEVFRLLSSELLSFDKRICDIDIVSKSEKEKILYKFNDSENEFDSKVTLKELFENRVEKSPDNIALVFDDKKITYAELNIRANQLARGMKASFGEGNKLVAIIIDRSIEMFVGVLGIIKAGYAYVPLEPGLPTGRIENILKCLSIQCVVTQNSNIKQVVDICEKIDSVSTIFNLSKHSNVKSNIEIKDFNSVANFESNNLPDYYSSDYIAYIIYTSGSTGLPKGVVVKHRAVVNIVEWINRTFKVMSEDKILFVSSLGFDLSVYDIFGGLSSGSSVHIVSSDELKDPNKIQNKILNENITIWNSAPAVFQQVLQIIELNENWNLRNNLRLVLLSGDWIPIKLPTIAKKYFNKVKVISLGGATEATIWSNYYFIEEINPSWNSIPYGKPIQNCKYYILDNDLNVLPTGIIGDLYIGGECLAEGYVNDANLTKNKFIENPFSKDEVIYHTGDLARWYPDGNMELIGRKDSQVKINGYRIELGEIESQLLLINDINEALVITDTTNTGDKYIRAYVISDKQLDINIIIDELSKVLPKYMLPKYIIQIDKYPLTKNGKIDRKKLPREDFELEIKKPSNKVQNELLNLYSEILEIPNENISITSNFFELGGHSLNVNILRTKIEKNLNLKIPISEIFRNPTIEELALFISNSTDKSSSEIKNAEKKEYYNITSVQRRLYTMDSIIKDSTSYIISGCLEIIGKLNVKKLESSLNKIINNHESLRTYFDIVDGEIVQRIKEKGDVNLEIEILEKEGEDQLEMAQGCVKAFNLKKAPLINFYLIKENNEKQFLIMNIHHIIFDGYSLKNLVDELMLSYRDEEIDEPKLQYKDYSEWTHSANYKQIVQNQEKYWAELYKNKIQRLNLPYDFERKEDFSLDCEKVSYVFEKELMKELKEMVVMHKSTMFMVQFSIVNILLSKLSKQNDIIVGVPVINRSFEGVDKTMGMFVNTLALRNFPDNEKTLIGFLDELTENTTKAMDNDSYPFESLVENVKEEETDSQYQNPIFDVSFQYDNLGYSKFELPDVKVKINDQLVNQAKFDLLFEIKDSEDVMSYIIEYKTNLFKRETIDWIKDKLLLITNYFITKPDTKIGEIDIFKMDKQKDVIHEDISFNF